MKKKLENNQVMVKKLICVWKLIKLKVQFIIQKMKLNK